jgi:hypothetical protein
MIFHIWPFAGLLVVAQAVKKRSRAGRKQTDSTIDPMELDSQVDEREQA